jgi:NAD/NADP transhydrogenase beta subunit
MIWLGAFLALVGGLSVASAIRREPEKALAYAFILGGLLLMLAVRGHANGWIAFAVWTLISYLILNFPIASTLYLASAFCYIFGLWGLSDYAAQVASNIAGLLGLVAVWYGRPKWQYVGNDRPSRWGAVSVAADVARGRARAERPSEEKPECP